MGKQFSLAQNSAFNTIGTLVYYVTQWIITLVVVRCSTDKNIGLLQLSMTVTNIFANLAYYNMREFQVSDIKNQYSFGHYLAVRFLTCFAALLLCIGYCILWNYSFETIRYIAIYMVYRVMDCIADVIYGLDQKHARMDHVMISLSLRGLLVLLVFYCVILFSNNLFMAISMMTAVNMGVILLYDFRCSGHFEKIIPRFEWNEMKGIIKQCFPATVGLVCFTSTVTIPRQNLGIMLGQDILGYYATVATPLVFVQVLVNSLLAPSITELSLIREEKNQKRFWEISGKLLLIILGVGIVAYIGILSLGEPIMQLLYGEKIIPYISLMYPVIGCTMLYAACCMGFNLLIVLRRIKTYLIISIIAFLIALLVSKPLIWRYGANGVSISVIIAYFIAATMSFWVVYMVTDKWIYK